MADRETAHYAALIRLQVAMSALQDMLGAVSDPEDADRLDKARENAQAAIEIALGGRHDVPSHLMRNWADAAMKRDATKVLAASVV